MCVVKWVRSSHHCSEDHLAASVRTAEVAAEIVWNFLHSMKSLSWAIMINKPRVVVCDQSGDYGGKYAIMEPYIRKFQKFNCNSGWAIPSDRTYAKILQALSHFSYVWSGGKYLLCDLQGGVDVHSKTIYLTDPAILTEQSRQFGCSDTGKKAMRNFFHHHVCNELCHHLTTPKDKKLFFRPLEATMVSQ